MINDALDIALLFVGVVFIVFLFVYSPRLRGWFGAFKKQKHYVNEKINKIAVIIPARNESKVIGALLDSLKKQTYGKENFEVFLVLKESDDPTIGIAEKYGVNYQVVPGQTCKGDALEASIKKIMSETPDKFDAYCIVDADSLLAPDFLLEMNNCLATGAKVVQGKKVVKNYLSKNRDANSVASCCNGIIWTIIDELGNRYKSDHNITQMVIGTGFMMTADVVKEIGGWPYRETLTEDIEFMSDCALRHIKTAYTSYALVYVEEATSHKMTNMRRSRWLDGVVNTKRVYNSRLKTLTKTKEDRRNRFFVTALTPVFYYITITTIFMIVFLLTALTLFVLHDKLFEKSLMYALYCFLLIYGSFFIMTAFCLIIDRKYVKLSFLKKIGLLFVHPFFYMEYIPIIARVYLFKSKGWQVIERVESFSTDGGE